MAHISHGSSETKEIRKMVVLIDVPKDICLKSWAFSTTAASKGELYSMKIFS